MYAYYHFPMISLLYKAVATIVTVICLPVGVWSESLNAQSSSGVTDIDWLVMPVCYHPNDNEDVENNTSQAKQDTNKYVKYKIN